MVGLDAGWSPKNYNTLFQVYNYCYKNRKTRSHRRNVEIREQFAS